MTHFTTNGDEGSVIDRPVGAGISTQRLDLNLVLVLVLSKTIFTTTSGRGTNGSLAEPLVPL